MLVDDSIPVPLAWKVLPPADRQSAEKLLGLLRHANGPETLKPIWFLPGGAEFGRKPGAKLARYQINLAAATKRLSEDPSKRRSV